MDEIVHLPAEYLSGEEAITACEETVGRHECTEDVDDATCLDCLRASILPALAQGRREGTADERAAIVAYLRRVAGILDTDTAAAIERGDHIPTTEETDHEDR